MIRNRFFLLFFFISSVVFGQEKVTVSGYLTDETNGEALLYGNVYIKNTTVGVNTNEYGFYSMDVPKGAPVVLGFSYLGFDTKEIEVTPTADMTLNVALTPEGAVLEEIEVVATRTAAEKEEVQSTRMSTITLPVDQIKTIPSLGGEVDVIKVVQLLPGVGKGGEGGTGMFVRGGDADQNLVLLDEATVYNIGHLFGFFSVFNPDAIKDLSMVKGGFPANYGGRLSSVLDIRMKEGNNREFHGEGGIGLLSSRLTVEAPIIKDRMSFLVSGRRTYIDQLMKSLGAFLPYYFYDLNVKINYRLSDKDRIFLSGYFGDDVLKFDETISETDSTGTENFDLNFGFSLGNFTQTLRWNHIYNPKLFSNLSLIRTSFNYDIGGKVGDNRVLVQSEIKDLGAKMDFTKYETEKTQYRFGSQMILHRFRPNILSARGDVSEFIDDQAGDIQTTLEMAFYGNAEFQPLDQLKVNAGLRLSAAAVRNRFYFGPEPRLSATWLLNENQSVKFSYSRMYQYMHRVSSSTIALPTDLWYPVSARVRPQSADQLAAGFSQYLEGAGLSLSGEVYYKGMRNLIEYKEGTNLIFNDNFENQLLQGRGNSYGAEILVRKRKGKLNGWVGYTLSWSRRHFDGLNNGRAFWAKYDRRHNLAFVLNWDINARCTFSAVWEFASGARFTP
ncbi:MAG: TonB-dependent receptor, partial [Bacteroidetes bacterium]